MDLFTNILEIRI